MQKALPFLQVSDTRLKRNALETVEKKRTAFCSAFYLRLKTFFFYLRFNHGENFVRPWFRIMNTIIDRFEPN